MALGVSHDGICGLAGFDRVLYCIRFGAVAGRAHLWKFYLVGFSELEGHLRLACRVALRLLLLLQALLALLSLLALLASHPPYLRLRGGAWYLRGGRVVQRMGREGGGNAGCFSGYCQRKEIAFGVWDLPLVGSGVLVAALVGCPLAAWLGCPLAEIGLRAAGAVGLVAKRVVACCGGGWAALLALLGSAFSRWMTGVRICSAGR
jgi:hypothetical protein